MMAVLRWLIINTGVWHSAGEAVHAGMRFPPLLDVFSSLFPHLVDVCRCGSCSTRMHRVLISVTLSTSLRFSRAAISGYLTPAEGSAVGGAGAWFCLRCRGEIFVELGLRMCVFAPVHPLFSSFYCLVTHYPAKAGRRMLMCVSTVLGRRQPVPAHLAALHEPVSDE